MVLNHCIRIDEYASIESIAKTNFCILRNIGHFMDRIDSGPLCKFIGLQVELLPQSMSPTATM